MTTPATLEMPILAEPVAPIAETTLQPVVAPVVEQPVQELAPVVVPSPLPVVSQELAPAVLEQEQIQVRGQLQALEQEPPTMGLNLTYLGELYKPYQEVIAAVDAQAILNWLPQVFSEETTNGITSYARMIAGEQQHELTADDLRNSVSDYLTRAFFGEYANPLVTPWTLAQSLSGESEKLFGPPTATLPVVVVVGPSEYVHLWTQDTAYGILLGLQKNPGVRLFLSGAELAEGMFDAIYSVPPQTSPRKTFSALFHSGHKQFDSQDVLTGYITGCTWLGLDPRAMIRDIKQLTVAENGTKLFTPITF